MIASPTLDALRSRTRAVMQTPTPAPGLDRTPSATFVGLAALIAGTERLAAAGWSAPLRIDAAGADAAMTVAELHDLVACVMGCDGAPADVCDVILRRDPTRPGALVVWVRRVLPPPVRTPRAEAERAYADAAHEDAETWGAC